MQITLFGYAINFDVRNLATVVQDDANSSMSREFIAQLQGHAGGARQLHHQLLRRDSRRLMREGRASMAVVIPRDFERRLQSRHAPRGADPRRRLAAEPRRSRGRHRRDADARAPRRGTLCRRQTHDAAAHRDPHALQPREAHRRADRAGADRRDPLDDHGAVHLRRHRARTRARQPRAADRDAARPARAHGGQTTAVRRSSA